MNPNQLVIEFESQGVALIESLMTPTQIVAAQTAVEWAMSQKQERYKWIRQRTYEWFETHPIFVELMEHPLALEIAGRILGSDFHLIAAQCSRNTKDDPYAPGAMNIHRDKVFFPTDEKMTEGILPHHYGFSAMWYVQDTPLEMGPTELILRSHLTDNSYRQDALDGVELFRRSIPAGSLLLFFHRTWHRGAWNQTDTPRDLITNAYARREIDKVQLTSSLENEGDCYVPCEQLLKISSESIRKLLRA
ncbi:MAG: phytanoyl-CoA dioxygenase family protein [Planctomycetota bacterium]|nr:phytanoyl-CoA dioxygenase family protein [Planctomycetota bacterium]MDA1138335.1 phytanoyl-CoA dioxygenase family protein [Planctomycetota bacterium]